MYCVARDGNNRWRLEFNVRDVIKDDGAPASSDPDLSVAADPTSEKIDANAGDLSLPLLSIVLFMKLRHK